MKDWDKNLKKITLDLNESLNKTTQESPFKLLYGYFPRHNEGELRKLTKEENTYQRPEQLQTQARERILKEQQKYKARYDQHKYRNVHYEKGDIVFMRTVPTVTGESTKLQNKYRGPLVITKVLPNDTYGISDLRSDKEGRRYASTAHVSQLKIWKPTETEDETFEKDESEDSDPGVLQQELSTEPEEVRTRRRMLPPKKFQNYITGRKLEDEFNRMAEC